MHTRRLFVGIPLSPSFAKRALSKTEQWKHLPVRFTSAEMMHVMLAFLGLVKDEELDRLCEELREAVMDIESFELSFDRIEMVPEAGEGARMVWLSGEPSGELAKLRNALERSIASFDPEYKEFRPHVTLGRILRGRWMKLSERPDLSEAVRLVEPVGSITLFESVAEGGKRKYIPLSEFELK